MSFCNNGLAFAESNGKWGIIDSKGNWVIQPQFDEFEHLFFGTKAIEQRTAKINEKWGVIDSKGNWVIQPQFDEISMTLGFDQELKVTINRKVGYMDLKGNWIIQPKFESATLLYDEYCDEILEYNQDEDDEISEDNLDEDYNDNIYGIPAQNIDFDLFLSEYVDNRITFIGHEAVKKQIEKGYKNTINFVETIGTFYEHDIDFKKIIQEITMASIEFHFIYRPWGKWMPQPSLIIVFSIDDLLMILLRGDDENGNYAQYLIVEESQLRVIEEKRYSAKIQLDDIQGYLKIDKRDGGLLSLPFSKWKYSLEDIINAINDMIQSTNPD